jgi:hypothetical protein
MSDEPVGAVGHNLKFVSHSDQGGRGDGVQTNVVDGYAYVGHMFTGGVSVIDVRDPREPKYVRFIEAPPNSWSIHLQAHENLLLVMNGVDIYKAELGIEKDVYYSKRSPIPLATRSATSPPECASSTSRIALSRVRSGSCRWRASACIASGTTVGATPTSRRCSTATPTQSSLSSIWPIPRIRRR